ncbi:MAG TPA: decaprenyl-phosphate phosphoribosyltransferase [Solirubrobacterales bacterium]|nr:decaprenyl-phosphate phosphoribosyltransferase [Solirubrobacterales bacterium]
MEGTTMERPAVSEDPSSSGEAPRRRRGPVRAAIKAMRPQEWVKNLLVFAGLLFSGQFDEIDAILAATVTFVTFCMVASAGYLVNDAHDVEEDRRHPKKRFRPIAAGELGIPSAITLAVVLAVAGLAGSTLLEGPAVGGLVLAYGVGTTLYSYVLKHEVILDVMTIAGLFVLRVLAGAIAVDADASAFLLLCTGMVALFLGFTKRRQEATSELHSGTDSRPVLEHYSIPFLDQMVAMVTASTVMSYAIYCVYSPLIGSKMLGTLPPVIYGIFRYLYLVYDRKDTRSTDAILLEDKGMIGAAVFWVATAVVLIAVYN